MSTWDGVPGNPPWDGIHVTEIPYEMTTEFDEAVLAFANQLAVQDRGREIHAEKKFQSERPPDPASFVDGDVFEGLTDEPVHFVLDGPLFKVGVSTEDGDHPTVLTFVGASGAGKSTILGDLMRCACDGDQWGGDLFGSTVSMPEGRRVVYANLEMSATLLRSRFLRPLGIMNKARYRPITLTGLVPILAPSGREWWIKALSSAEAFVWIVDSYAVITASDVDDENGNSSATRAIAALRDIAARAGVRLVVLIDHTGWATADRVRGAAAKKDRVDETLSYELKDQRDPTGPRLLTHTKARWSDGAPCAEVEWDPTTRRHVFTPTSKSLAAAEVKESAKNEKLDRLRTEIIRRRDAGEPPILNREEARSVAKCMTSETSALRQRLVDECVIEKAMAGPWKPYVAPY